MPAKNLSRVVSGGSYSHIYNKGVEDRLLFKDDQDYQIFTKYLKAYLSAPVDPEATKTHFIIKGRTYKGTPHQPKNYFKRIELISYCLAPNHFHLVLHQVEDNSVERFIRSLCTRYSMYFNKKYSRSGSLFNGPYKSIEVKDNSQLLLLTNYLHDSSSRYSSKTDYQNQNINYWITFIDGGDKKFNPSEEEKDILRKISFEDINTHSKVAEKPQANTTMVQKETSVENIRKVNKIRFPEIFASVVIFVFLIGISISNIQTSAAKDSERVLGVISELPTPSSTPYVSPTPIASVSATFRPRVLQISKDNKMLLSIQISDGSPSVNIRETPSITGEKVGTAINGQVFEYLYYDPVGWYKIVLSDGVGYISTKYVKLQQNVNQ